MKTTTHLINTKYQTVHFLTPVKNSFPLLPSFPVSQQKQGTPTPLPGFQLLSEQPKSEQISGLSLNMDPEIREPSKQKVLWTQNKTKT